MTPRVAIIGAGLAGLTAAHRLLARPSPPEVTVIDKGRHGGGRMCTRTVELPDGRKAKFDLGPPLLFEWRQGGRLAAMLADELAGEQFYQPRVVGRIGTADEIVADEIYGLSFNGGMRELPFRLLNTHAGRFDFRDHTLVEKLERTEEGWRVHTRSLRDEHQTTITANALVVTPPLPQTLELLERNNIVMPDAIRDALRKVTYSRCIAIYGMFAGADGLQPGGVWLGDGPLEWITDNHLKAVSPLGPAITGLTTDKWAETHWNEPDTRLIELLLPRLRPWVGAPLDAAQVWVHKWRWARPVSPVALPCALLRDLAVVLAGDGFANENPEPADAAVASGGAAANRIGQLLNDLGRRDGRYTVSRPRRYELEVAVTTPTEAVRATRAGADRLELSSGLDLGGLTPSIGLFRAVRQVAPDVPLYVLIRPRPGGFAYSANEFAVMVDDAETFLNEGANGIVFAALTQKGQIHRDSCRRLVQVAKAKQGKAVFHRAFDFLPEPLLALDALIELEFDRVLTSGGQTTAEAGTTQLAALVQHAGWQIGVVPAGRVRAHNVAELVRATRCDQVHAGPRVAAPDEHLGVRPTLANEMGRLTGLDADAVSLLRQQLDGLVESLS